MEILNDMKGNVSGKVLLTKDDVDILKDALIFYSDELIFYSDEFGTADESLTLTLIKQFQSLQDNIK